MTLQQLHDLTGKVLKENPDYKEYQINNDYNDNFICISINESDGEVILSIKSPINVYMPE